MPMVIPVIAAWAGAAGAVGAIAAGTATFASYLAVAGAVLTTVGAVTKKKDLMLVGGLMGLGAGLIGNASGTAASAGTEAAASESAGSVFNAAKDSAGSNTVLADNALNASAQTADVLGTQTLGAGSDTSMTGMAGSREAVGSLQGLQTPAASSVSPAVAYGQAGNPLATGGQALATDASSTTGALDWLNKIGSHVKQNKELYAIGGQMLQGMFGPEAESLDMQRREMERRRRNANTIIPLGQIGMLGKV